jgi:hypothetical protein
MPKLEITPVGKWATVRQAAGHYNVSRARIHQLIQKDAFSETKAIDAFGRKLWLIAYPFVRADLSAKTGIHKPGCDHCKRSTN